MREEEKEEQYRFNPNINPITGEKRIRPTVLHCPTGVQKVNKDWCLIQPPRKLDSKTRFLVFSPALTESEYNAMHEIHRWNFNVRGGVLQHLSDYPRKHSSIYIMQNDIEVLIFYNDDKFAGVEYISEAINKIDNAKIYYPVFDGMELVDLVETKEKEAEKPSREELPEDIRKEISAIEDAINENT